MQINKLLTSCFIVILGWLTFTTSYAVSGNDPVATLQYIADNMIAGLKQNEATLKTKPQIVYNLAYKYVVPYADLTEMSKHVLPPQTWNSATAAQRAQFQKEFTRTLIRTYASALTSYRDQSIRFFPIRGGYQNARTIAVNSEITSSASEPIHVTYRMVRVGGAWRLYDLSVEGVSMLDSFRAQFEDILSQGNIAALLDKMSSHNSR